MEAFLQPLADNWPILVVSLVSLITMVLSFCLVFFKTRRAKQELELQKIEYEKQKLRLEEAALTGSFLICPQCQNEIYLKDAKIHFKS